MSAASIASHTGPTPGPESTLEAAKGFIARGWFPLALHGVVDLPDGTTACTCKLGPTCPDAGKHPIATGWSKQSTPDLSPWERRATLPTNVGIVTGPKSGIWVPDFDMGQQAGGRPPGFVALDAAGELEPTLCSQTGSDGLHLLYALPDDGFVPTNRRGRMPDLVDVRGKGGFIVAPPSVSARGPYRWLSDLPVMPARAALVDRIRSAVRPSKPAATPKGAPAAAGPQRPAQSRREAKLEASVISGEVQRLADLDQPWHQGARWDSTIFEVACQLVQLANSDWSALTVERAHALVVENAPRDEAWDEAEAKFVSAVQSVGDKQRPSPTEGADPGDPFSGYVPPGPTAAPAARQAGRPSREAQAAALAAARAAYRRWLGDEYPIEVLDTVLATAAVERLDGDPAWLLVVSGSGAAKTETLLPLGHAGALVTSTVSSEGALLSGTSRKERSSDSTGGLLRKVGASGVVVIKDVTSLLSMNRDARASVLAALREVHDGFWERNLGSDGGQSLTWSGRLVVIGAVTTAWDKAHEAIAAMGDRFVLVRLDSTQGRLTSGRRAIGNTGNETAMRAELGAAVAAVLACVDPAADLTLTSEEGEAVLAVADVVTLARTGVEHDYRGDVVDAHAPEMPTRFAKELTQIMRGGLALGMDREHLLRVVVRCAADSMPPLRLAVLLDLAVHPHSRVGDVCRRMEKPRATVDRAVQALHVLGLAVVDEVVTPQGRTAWHYTVSSDYAGKGLQALSSARSVDRNTHPLPLPLPFPNTPCTDISGTGQVEAAPTSTWPVEMTAASCSCGKPLSAQRHSYGKSLCVDCEATGSSHASAGHADVDPFALGGWSA